MRCGHLLCELIGDARYPCSLAIQRSRGCHRNITARQLAPEVLDEVRALLARLGPAIDAPSTSDDARDAAVRLASLIRREALDDRNLVALAAEDEPELAPALDRLCRKS